MVCKTIRLQRTFREYESKAIEWIESLHKAFCIKKIIMTRKEDPDRYCYKWTVIAKVENQ